MSFQAMAWAVEQAAETPLQKLLLLILANYADEAGESWPSQSTIARQCHCTRQGVQKALGNLETLGLLMSIGRVSHGAKDTNLYRLQIKEGSQLSWQGGENSVGKGSQLSWHKPIIEPITSKKEAKTPPKKVASDFEEWWALYPHKIGKIAAKKKYEIALRHVAGASELWLGVHRYIRDKPADRPWWNPATWLHQGRWKDQPAPEPGKVGWGEAAKAMMDEPTSVQISFQKRTAQ